MELPTATPSAVAATGAVLFIPSFGDGGVERMMVNIARGLSEMGTSVDFITRTEKAPYLDRLPPEVRLITLDDLSSRAVEETLVEHLRRIRPAVVLAAKLEDETVALRSRDRAAVSTRVVVRVGTTFSAQMLHPFRIFKQWQRERTVRRLYARADEIICVSKGVADDLARITRIGRDRLTVLPNPVVTPELLAEGAAPLEHPWFDDHEPPVILAAARLSRPKNFPLLIRAFSRVRAEMPCRLIILGEGRKRSELERLVRRLGLQEEIQLPGFAANPHAFMRRAGVFVLPSNLEGSPNALVEAMALGTPVVSTDCPSGPREILDGGRVAPLVPCGDVQALAAAILSVLRQPPPADELRRAASRYTLANSARAYHRALGLGAGR